jgi:negative regulator of flagellin synthesis FlgM
VSNKIGSGGIDSRPAQVGSDRAIKRANSVTGGETSKVTKPDAGATGVQITDSARQLAALEAAIRDLPDVDEARVAAIRLAISNGTYEVAPDRIADKLLRLEGELR